MKPLEIWQRITDGEKISAAILLAGVLIWSGLPRAVNGRDGENGKDGKHIFTVVESTGTASKK